MFVLDPAGQGLLLMGSTKALAGADWWSIAAVTLDRRARHRRDCRRIPGLGAAPRDAARARLLIVAGFALVYPGSVSDAVGLSLIVAVLAMQHFIAAPAAAAALAKDA